MILQRYTLRETFSPFFLGFATVTFLLVLEFLLDYLKLILEKGVPVLIVGKLFLLSLGWMVALSLPCGVLVGMLMTFGRMSQDNEILAMRSAGISLFALLRPALAWGLFWTVAIALFNSFVLPWSNHEFAQLVLEINRKKPTARLEEGLFIDAFDGHRILFDELDQKTGAIRGVKLLDFAGTRLSTTIADRGRVAYDAERGRVVLELHDGEMSGVPDDAVNPSVLRRTTFRRHEVAIGGDGADGPLPRRQGRGLREMGVGQLRGQITELDTRASNLRASETDKLRALGYAGYDEMVAFLHPPGGLPERALALLRGQPRLDLPAVGRRFVGPPDLRIEESAKMARVQIESLEKRAGQHRVELHKKFSISVACVIFVLVGAPLGILARSGGIRAGFLSVVFLLFYYLCLVGGEQLADRRLLWPWLSMWLANIVLGALGIYLTLRVADVGFRRRR